MTSTVARRASHRRTRPSEALPPSVAGILHQDLLDATNSSDSWFPLPSVAAQMSPVAAGQSVYGHSRYSGALRADLAVGRQLTAVDWVDTWAPEMRQHETAHPCRRSARDMKAICLRYRR